MLGEGVLIADILITVPIWHAYWEMFLLQSSTGVSILNPPDLHSNEKRENVNKRIRCSENSASSCQGRVLEIQGFQGLGSEPFLSGGKRISMLDLGGDITFL